MINVNEFKPGITFEEDGAIFVVLEAQHSKQGRGQANVKAKVKNLRTGSTTIKTWTGGDRVKKARIDKKSMTYLYNDGGSIVLMEDETYEQIYIDLSKVEWELNFLKENSKVVVRMYHDEVLDIELPANVDLVVTEAPDAVKGNTTTNPQKRIIVETGFELEAPMFIKENDIISISTESGKYMGKANK
ncbi:elongation factor P [Mycoplasma phocimorsus]|uniref:Elongation factor P n=1 Tax=Mycoplasma phocimorsus TaxID=3045839 RepID=A0AAJ1PU19_9MOLU|nr:elongation factor P [Mycoplasma phocimorsus]MDJ1645831.1 elongation factor P [Mycoplasma phocimorsus]MDJ1646438.1 elongation factor P [Mycoplasma phocimorsus]MDJ1646998.1 elongation factor P [Mycoplasma phocimorsus]MDJ1647446.1 elongation factor P [Mycoplasma phocimorsus]MDJ1648022.1 elongation factor P [Mycoplasma phocimorsus]